jgi:protein-L-isoaspartate(D-aspartate) O-methyltransferase
MADFELQRKNMVESQVRPSDITDRRIMRAMLALPREMFAADDTRTLAYMDQQLPTGPRAAGASRRALLSPRVLARLLQLAEIEPGDRVLEIGTGTGYGAAIMSHMARTVVALEADEGLASCARKIMNDLAIENVSVVTGPHPGGWKAEAPYAAIVLGGAVPEISPGLLDQLQDGGRLAAVVSSGGIGQVMQWRRIGSTFASRRVAEAGAALLPGFERAPGFAF